ncbi:phosphotransferase family protein [Elioraea sp.]|jgi:aminoglycoside phosphotransferase (APT) family kinase protein|uniref:phosphotransferase family protein n=1 Tax=Elioraea sp. TaxID=2185103 RepID=UPI0021DBCD04|nr:phosphotransferase family protein [Elioraea sp.]GIX11413.1 MAG: phosphotransferase [Elioraea sp.]
MDEARRARLEAWLRAETGDAALAIADLRRLSGGAIQQNWALDVRCGDGRTAAWVLRTDNAATLAVSHGRAEEFALLRAAHAAGVTVPEPLLLCPDRAVIGAPFFVMRRVEGVAAGHRVVRCGTLAGGRRAAAEAVGRELARIHAIRPPRADLAFLGAPPADPAAAFLADQQRALDRQRDPHPILEWGLRHLARRAPAPVAPVLCHNDFRTGNIMFDARGVTAVLDWEFAGWGDPHADLGWLCAKCWRFGNDAEEAGGIGPRDALYAGYADAGGAPPDPGRVAWWEIAAHLRWATIALDQAERHLSGAEPSLELALTGHIVPQLEWDILAAVEARDAA